MENDLIRRYIVFAMGLVCITMGIAIITKGGLGTGPITAIPYSLSMVFPALSIGGFTILYSILLVTLRTILTGRENIDRTVAINIALEYVICFVFGYMVDIAMWAFSNLNPTEYWARIACVIVGIPILATGVYLQTVANVVMVPGDGFVYALALRIKRKYSLIRMGSDTTMVVIAAMIGLIGIGTLGGVREGTILCCLLTGIIARRFMKWFEPLTGRLVPGRSLTVVADGSSKNV